MALPARVAELATVTLYTGSHDEDEGRMCAMEMVSYLANEPFSDSPACTSTVLASFVRAWNDGLPTNEDRDRLLKPFLPKLIGTRAITSIEERRSYMALDWLIRVHTPKFLDLVPALHEHAVALRSLEGVADMAGATAAGEKVRAARAAARAAAGAAAWDAAWAAARDAAWAAARDAAWAAAWDAAWAAARDAARDAAWDAAWAAAWAAAGDAAWAAAWAAARDALKPTVEWLQASASDLLQRMIEVQ